jgi:integrase
MGAYRRGEMWWIDYFSGGKRVRESVGHSKKMALTIMAKRRMEVAQGKHPELKRRGKTRFRDFAQVYMETHAIPNKLSWKTSDAGLVKNLSTFFDGMYLHEITSYDIERYKTKRQQGVSPATVNRSLSCLRCMFNRAISWGYVTNNPVSRVRFLREDNKRLRYLDVGEIRRLLIQSSPQLQAVIMVAINTGMRKGELRGLCWKDVDLKQGVITLLKTKSGRVRHIPINTACGNALTTLQRHPKSEYVFTKEDGTTYDVRKGFGTALKRAGIVGFRFHDLRHTFASHMAMSGADLTTLRDLLGHKDFSLTLRYAHLSPDHKASAVEKLGEQLGKLPVTITSQFEDLEKRKKSAKIHNLIPEKALPALAHVAQLVEQRFRKP